MALNFTQRAFNGFHITSSALKKHHSESKALKEENDPKTEQTKINPRCRNHLGLTPTVRRVCWLFPNCSYLQLFLQSTHIPSCLVFVVFSGREESSSFLPEFGSNDDCRQDEQRGDGHRDVELRVHCNTHTHTQRHMHTHYSSRATCTILYPGQWQEHRMKTWQEPARLRLQRRR